MASILKRKSEKLRRENLKKNGKKIWQKFEEKVKVSHKEKKISKRKSLNKIWKEIEKAPGEKIAKKIG